MRYPQGGGLTPERQMFRERIRMEAAEQLAAGASNAEAGRGSHSRMGEGDLGVRGSTAAALNATSSSRTSPGTYG